MQKYFKYFFAFSSWHSIKTQNWVSFISYSPRKWHECEMWNNLSSCHWQPTQFFLFSLLHRIKMCELSIWNVSTITKFRIQFRSDFLLVKFSPSHYSLFYDINFIFYTFISPLSLVLIHGILSDGMPSFFNRQLSHKEHWWAKKHSSILVVPAAETQFEISS